MEKIYQKANQEGRRRFEKLIRRQEGLDDSWEVAKAKATVMLNGNQQPVRQPVNWLGRMLFIGSARDRFIEGVGISSYLCSAKEGEDIWEKIGHVNALLIRKFGGRPIGEKLISPTIEVDRLVKQGKFDWELVVALLCEYLKGFSEILQQHDIDQQKRPGRTP